MFVSQDNTCRSPPGKFYKSVNVSIVLDSLQNLKCNGKTVNFLATEIHAFITTNTYVSHEQRESLHKLFPQSRDTMKAEA